MTGKYKCEFQLEQYTPLLHFQGDQSGACLRASEVKPKLDRFVMAWLVKKGIQIPASWTDDEQGSGYLKDAKSKIRRTSLRYRMSFSTQASSSIECNEQDKWIENKKVPGKKQIHELYFGAMGREAFGPDGKSKIKAVTYPDKAMTLRCICMVSEKIAAEDTEMTLLEILEKLIPPFFALTCFGTRSNKGFGSFGVYGYTAEPEELKEYAPEKVLYYVEYKERPKSNRYLDDVDSFSKIMKAGFNHGRGNYYQGFVREYFTKGKIHTEKAFIKSEILVTDQLDKWEINHGKKQVPADSEFVFARALLGLPGGYAYMRGVRQKLRDVTVTAGNSGIARFGNPVHYKPHRKYLLLIPQSIPKAMLGTKFKIEDIDIPTPSEFNIVDFMDAFMAMYSKKGSALIHKLKNRNDIETPAIHRTGSKEAVKHV